MALAAAGTREAAERRAEALRAARGAALRRGALRGWGGAARRARFLRAALHALCAVHAPSPPPPPPPPPPPSPVLSGHAASFTPY